MRVRPEPALRQCRCELRILARDDHPVDAAKQAQCGRHVGPRKASELGVEQQRAGVYQVFENTTTRDVCAGGESTPLPRFVLRRGTVIIVGSGIRGGRAQRTAVLLGFLLTTMGRRHRGGRAVGVARNVQKDGEHVVGPLVVVQRRPTRGVRDGAEDHFPQLPAQHRPAVLILDVVQRALNVCLGDVRTRVLRQGSQRVAVPLKRVGSALPRDRGQRWRRRCPQAPSSVGENAAHEHVPPAAEADRTVLTVRFRTTLPRARRRPRQ
mmetsp:Transcript_5200/g.16496  ORF Transcript_5200/g.16496 Transcript_5200/m.16496 type:complete len:266 (-) Transcript_5200:18-815(-)